MEYMYQKPKVWLDIDISILICVENAPDVWSVSLYKKPIRQGLGLRMFFFRFLLKQV